MVLPGRRRRSLLPGVALLLVLALLGGSCGGGSDDGAAGPVTTADTRDEVATEPFTVLDGAASGPGTELGASGLVVSDGSVLLGGVFPDAAGDEGAFQALLLVLDDPVVAYNDYVDAARGLGMTSGDVGGCVVQGFGVSCARTLQDTSDGEVVAIRVDRRPEGDRWISHLGLRYLPPGSVEPAPGVPDAATPPTDPLPAVTLPASVRSADPAQWNQSVAPAGPLLGPVDGAELAGPPGTCGCGPGWSAVFRVQDTDQAIAGFSALFGVEVPEVDERRFEGTVAQVADLGLVPGGIAQLRTVSRGGEDWLMVAMATP